MRRLGFILTLLSLPLAAQTPYGRLNFQLQNAQGQAISGATVYVYAQSACGVAADLTNPATIYSTALGTVLPQPVTTDGFGTAFAYTPLGCYTVVYYSPYTGTITLVDQNAVAASSFTGGPFCPLTGCTLVGALTGTSATFSGALSVGTLSPQQIGMRALAAPAAPVCAIGGAGASLTGAYEWEVAFRTAVGITNYSPPCAYLTLAGQSAQLTLPVDTSGLAQSWVIRRTAEWTDPATGRTPFFMDIPFWYDAEVTYNGAARTWADPNLDTALGPDVPFNVEVPDFNTTSTPSNYFSPIVSTATPTFSPVDNRPLKDTPDVTLAYPQTPVSLVGTYNVSTCTEAITASTCGWSSNANMGLDTTSTRTVTGVAPTAIVLNHFVATAAGTAGGGPFQSISGHMTLSAGQAYLMSYFVQGNTQQEQVNSHGWNTGATNSWDYAFIDHILRRKWFYCVAVTTTTMDCGQNPNVAFGSGTGSGQMQWDLAEFANFNNYLPPNLSTFSSDRYIGGFQVEAVATTAYGIVAPGDSLTQVDCKGYASYDTAGCSSWTVYAAGLMNVPVYNRGHGGVTMDVIHTDYLGTTGGFAGISGRAIVQAARAKYVIIEGGGNDFSSGRSAATVESELQSFAADVVSDGAQVVYTTITPRTGQGQNIANFEQNRQAYNAWLRGGCSSGASPIPGGCPLLIDLDAIVRDPIVPSIILNNPGWVSPLDGTHFQINTRRAIGEFVAASYVGNTTGHPQIFDFPKPLAYQSVPVSTPTQNFTAGHAVISAANNQLADGGVLPSAPGLADNVTPGLMKGDGASISCTAGTCTATTGGGGTVVVDTPGTFSAADIVPRSTAAGIKIGPSSIRDDGTKVYQISGMTADGLMGVSTVVAHLDSTGNTANIVGTNMLNAAAASFTVPVSPAVIRYRVCARATVTTAGDGTGMVLPSVRVQYTDPEVGTINPIIAAGLSGSTVGGSSATTTGGCSPISASAGSTFSVNTSGNNNGGGGTLQQYSVHVTLEAIR